MSAQNASQSDERIEKLITVLGQRMNALAQTLQMIAESLQGIELHLREMSISSNPAPNYRRPLSDYQDFDWGIIGAIVLKEDEDGATEVEWNGQVFTRRSAENHFDAAVWYSRCVGKDSDGKNKYLRLITFLCGRPHKKVNVANSIMWRPQLNHLPATLLCRANAT